MRRLRYRLATAALAASLGLGLATPAGAGGLVTYRGGTSQDTPVRLYVEKKDSGRRFLRLFIARGFAVTCEDATTHRFSLTHTANQNLGKDGVFEIGSEQSGLLSFHYVANGIIRFKRASGTFDFRLANFDVGGSAQLCSTGLLEWSAVRVSRTRSGLVSRHRLEQVAQAAELRHEIPALAGKRTDPRFVVEVEANGSASL